MGILKVILIIAVVKSATADSDGELLKPCKTNNIDCLSESTQIFLERTSAGVPDFDIQPIDPKIIPGLDYDLPEFDLVFHFKNINVTGLKNQKISDFKLDKATKSVILQTRVDDAKVVSDLTIELKSAAKTFSGIYYATATVLGTSKYNYELIPNKEGVEYFEVGPETITCEVLSVEVTLDPELTKAIATSPEAKIKRDDYYKKATEIRKDVISKIFKKAYVTVIHNIRAAAKIFPKTAFFIDM